MSRVRAPKQIEQQKKGLCLGLKCRTSARFSTKQGYPPPPLFYFQNLAGNFLGNKAHLKNKSGYQSLTSVVGPRERRNCAWLCRRQLASFAIPAPAGANSPSLFGYTVSVAVFHSPRRAKSCFFVEWLHGSTIRSAAPADVPQILAFIELWAAYEREPDAVTATEAGLLRDGFRP